MDHVVIRDPELSGWAYGMLRSFERAIVEETRATRKDIPQYKIAKKYFGHFSHGMKRASYRKYFPVQSFPVTADVGWYILMGPEDYRLDVYNDWQKNIKTKILYLYDTFPSQYSLIKKLLAGGKWDLLITSFNDAVNDLEKITGRRWHCVEQAGDPTLFKSVPFNERVIHFSSYGRRYPALHEAIIEFTKSKGLYYDYTTHDGKHPVAEPEELYKQYCWHLNQSLFTFSWPVELTNPSRAGHLHPITCRWFEAVMAGTIILGNKPDNPAFDQMLDENFVIHIDSTANKMELLQKIEQIWERREDLFSESLRVRSNKPMDYSWNERVRRIVSMI